MFGDRIGKLLLKQAVEQNVCNHILASDTDIDAARRTMQMRAKKLSKRSCGTNGQISFPEVLRQQPMVTDGAADQKTGFISRKSAGGYMKYSGHARGR